MRIGHGFDAHRFAPGRPLILGGMRIPFEHGLAAHSDGDVLIHALCDALIGALGRGDIGRHFPDSNDQYKSIDSRILLRHVINQVREQGFSIVNADLTLIAQAPKVAPYIDGMRSNLALDLEVEASRVNIKATTTEGMGYTGRGEGVAAHAVVLLQA